MEEHKEIINTEKSMEEIIREKRKKDGIIVHHKFLNKYTLEEALSSIIKSHT